MLSLLTLPIRLALLPFKIAFYLIAAVLAIPLAILLLPFFLLRLAVKLLVALVLLPFVLVVAVLIALEAVGFLLLTPLIPLALLGFFVWAAFRLFSRPLAAV